MRQFMREAAALAGAALGGFAGWTYAPMAYVSIASDYADRQEVARIMAVPAVPFLLTLVGGVVGAILGAVLATLLAAGAAAWIGPPRGPR